MSTTAKIIVLAAGGTGGHLFPAQALAEELTSRGVRVHLMTDERVRDYGKSFPAEAVHVVPSASLSLSDPLRLPQKGLKLLSGLIKARSTLKHVRPALVAGFGGYPSFPPLVAAHQLRIPTLLHEQNAVLGRANARLARRATRIGLSFPETRGVDDALLEKSTVTGNPVRAVVMALAGAAYPALSAEIPFNIVVFGGSQGAQFFSTFMPEVFKAMPAAALKRLRVTQQCRPEDLERVQNAYAGIGLEADLAAFFSNLPERIAGSHLVICRSGASTIAELGVIGRPAVMVPLPHAIDNDQLRNAQSFASAGAGWLQAQHSMQPAMFAAFLAQLIVNEAQLRRAAAAATMHGKPNAAASLADLAQSIMA